MESYSYGFDRASLLWMVYEMILTVSRSIQTPAFTLGEFLIDGKLHYFTVEDAVRKEKIKGKTAIPAGKYQVIVNHSIRFDRRLPLLLDVPNFEGVRIHAGNTSEDTEGCILIGLTRAKNGVGASRVAMNDFMPRLEGALLDGPVWIEVRNAA